MMEGDFATWPRMTLGEFDVAVIGGGSGGYAAARTTAAGGLKTVVIDSAAELGGLCILRGCMPTKALLHAADVAHQAHRAGVWGIQVGEIRPDFRAVMARKNQMVAEFASYREKQLTDGRFKLLRAPARFLDPHTLQVGESDTLTARHVVISTGSTISHPPVPGLREAGSITSDDALRLERLPKSCIVLGGGAVAVEFAQFFQRMGCRVILLQRSSHLLRDFDPEAGETVARAFRREGMEVWTGTRILSCSSGPEGKSIEFEHEGQRHRVVAEEIFNGLGRAPRTAGLGLSAAGVATEFPEEGEGAASGGRSPGRILTDLRMRTSVPHIYAAGDCTGPHELVHLAVIQGEVVGHNILTPAAPRSMDYRLLTVVVFTDPQVATVGLTELEAKRSGIPIISASYPFNDHGKSMIMEALDGQVKLLADPGTGEILGGACVGPMGGELIHEVVVAMAARMTVREFAAIPHYHPTLAEIWTYPAEELAGSLH